MNGGKENHESESNSTPTDAPTSTAGLSSITAPSGGVGSYLGNRRGTQSHGSQAWQPKWWMKVEIEFGNIFLIVIDLLCFYISICKYNLYHFLHHNEYWKSPGVTNVLASRFYRVSGVTYSRLIFCTSKVHRIYKYTAQVTDVYSMLGLDSHADISCAGRDAHILAQREGKACTVRPFNDN